ncbi:hypothetical protein E4U52_002433 [Claviceps spartinae]|nr:hypothetical protein E4U52_002433 [Claviceps spartinae]
MDFHPLTMKTGVMSPSSAREDTGLRQGFNGDAQLLEFPIDNSENFFPGGWSGFPLLEQQDPSQMQQSYSVPSGIETGCNTDYFTTPSQPGVGSGFNRPIRGMSGKFPSQRLDPSRMNNVFLIRSNSPQTFQKALKNCRIDPNLPLPGSNPLSTPASHMWLPPSEVSPGTIPPYQPLPMATTRSTPSMCTPSMPGFATTPSASVQMQTVAPQMLQYSRSTPGLNSATATSGMDTNGFIQDGTDLLKIEEDLYAAPTPRPIQFMGAVAHESQRSTKKRTNPCGAAKNRPNVYRPNDYHTEEQQTPEDVEDTAHIHHERSGQLGKQCYRGRHDKGVRSRVQLEFQTHKHVSPARTEEFRVPCGPQSDVTRRSGHPRHEGHSRSATQRIFGPGQSP